MNTGQYDSILRDALEQHEGSYRAGSWERMEKILVRRRRRRGLAIILALGLLFVGVGNAIRESNNSALEYAKKKGDPQGTASTTSIPSVPMDQPDPAENFREPTRQPASSPNAAPEDIANSKSPLSSEGAEDKQPDIAFVPVVLTASPEVADANAEEPMDDGAIDDGAMVMEQSTLLTAPDLFIPIEEIEGLPVEAFPIDLEHDPGDQMEVEEDGFKQIGLNAYAGIPVSSSTGFESDQPNLFPFYAGAEVVYQFHRRWEAAIGLQYELLTLSAETRIVDQNTYLYGYSRQSYELTPRNVSYLSLPVMAHYKLSPKGMILLGVQYSALMQVYTHQNLMSSEQDVAEVQSNESLEKGYRTGFHEGQFSLLTGVGFNLQSRIRLDLQARIGLTPIRESDGSGDQVYLRLGLTYYLWRK